MPKYHKIADKVKAYIRKHGLKPGDPLPSERQLARRLNVAYGTIRLANDSLYREGLIDRRQGHGTFVAQPARTLEAQGSARRLGLLVVEMSGLDQSYVRTLAFSLQQHVQQAEHEFVIEHMDIDQLVSGKSPEMIRRQSVDGLFLYGRVRNHHIRFLQEQPLPYLLVGNRPVDAHVPQVRINAKRMAFEMTRELIQGGRRLVWLDVDPANTDYSLGQEMLTGYAQAVARFGADDALRLCSARLENVDQAVAMLLRSDLTSAAFIVADWSASLIMASLQAHDPESARQLLVVPMPFEHVCRLLLAPSVVRWSRTISTDMLAGMAVNSMIGHLQQRHALASTSLEPTCRLLPGAPLPTMELDLSECVLPIQTMRAEPSLPASGVSQ